jgi:enoyl-CoA hydratase
MMRPLDKTRITCQQDDEVATILLSAPEGKPPTLDGDVLKELERCIEQAREQQPRLVLIRSTSERFFCVGANINVLKETTEETIVPWVMQGHRVLNMLEDLPMPVVAIVEGYAMGGGLELAMACDLIFSSDQSKFAQSEAGLGFIPGWGGTRRLAARIGRAKAKYYFYSGKMVDAVAAAEVGLVDFVGTQEELDRELSDFTVSVIGNNQNAISQFKTILNNQERAARDENATVEACNSISCLQDADAKQRLSDFINKRGKK